MLYSLYEAWNAGALHSRGGRGRRRHGHVVCPDAESPRRNWCAKAVPGALFLRSRHAGNTRAARGGRGGRATSARTAGRFDLVLSYTGGGALDALRRRLGARQAVPLYGSVDPECIARLGRDPQSRRAFPISARTRRTGRRAGAAIRVEPAAPAPDERFVLARSVSRGLSRGRPTSSSSGTSPPAEHPAFYARRG